MFKLIIASTALTIFSTGAIAHSMLPDLKTATYPLHERSIDRTSQPGKVLLRFSNGVANVGRGRLEIRGGAVTGTTQKVYQRIFNTHGGYSTRLAGTFVYHPEHSHTHFDGFADYKLREVVGSSGVGDIIARSDKVSFCLIDDVVYSSRVPNYSRYPRYRSCSSTAQGISPGWVDVYDRRLFGQWIDITEVPSGEYWLESTADPQNRLKESNESNNTARVRVTIENN